MAERNSRKRSVPARLREETWYLVKYEDDENLRVLPEDEVCHIFPDEENDEMQIGDVISALWIPNGQYYDAKILAKGGIFTGDKNELMRERMRQEKAKKGGQKEIEAQQKRKNSEEEADAQKKKKKKQKQTESEKEQKAKDKEEKQKKKEQDRERQKFLLAARRAQAASRWAADSEVTTVTVNNPVDATFTPQPIHHRSSSPSCQSSTPLNANTSLSPNKNPSTSTTTIATFTPHPIRHRSSRPLCQSSTPLTTITTLSPDRTLTTPESIQSPTEEFLPANPPMPARPCIPARPTTSYKSKTICEPRRGLHFQSATAGSSDDETDEEVEITPKETDVSSSNCCKEQRLEIKALRKRLEKVHKRLNVALKAKTTADVVNNRPGAGIVDNALAEEFKMVEVMEGSGVFWYPHQRAYCSAFKSWPGYINAAIDIFFTKETLAVSNAKGNDRKSKNGDVHKPLTAMIIDALIGKVCSKFAKDSPAPSQIVQKINLKCVEARRPQRIRAPRRE